MRHEIEHIQPESDALKWAVGCVSTSYLRRLACLNVVQIALLRWSLAVFIASWALDDVFAAQLFYLKAAAALGLRIDESNASEFLSALAAVPSWSIALDGAAGLFYIASACWLVRRRLASLWILAAGTAVNGIACTTQVWVFVERHGPVPLASLRPTFLTYALHFSVIVLLWHGFSREGESSWGRVGNS